MLYMTDPLESIKCVLKHIYFQYLGLSALVLAQNILNVHIFIV